MQKVVTASEMKAIDRAAIEEFGIPGLVLMENAGLAAASLIHENVPELLEKKVVIVCGKGNNGGDGFVIARHLSIDGVRGRCLGRAGPRPRTARRRHRPDTRCGENLGVASNLRQRKGG